MKTFGTIETSHKLQYTEKSLIVKHVDLKYDEKTYV